MIRKRSEHSGPDKISELIAQKKVTSLIQPIVDCNNLEIQGYESFARGGIDGLYSPLELLRAARDHNLIKEVSSLCRQRAIEQLPKLKHDQKLFVNLHFEELGKSTMNYGSPDEPLFSCRPEQVVIELSEATSHYNSEDTAEMIALLRKHGFQIALSNLGGSLCSIDDIEVVKPDYIKIDKSLIRSIERSSTKRALVEMIVSLAQKEGAVTIAEGVEQKEEFKVINALGVDYSQGYFFSKPKPSVVDEYDLLYNKWLSSEKSDADNFDKMKYKIVNQLTEANAKLTRDARKRDALILSIVHYIKTPVTAIKLNAEAIDLHVSTTSSEPNPELLECTKNISIATDRLQSFVDDFMEYVMIQDSSNRLNTTTVDIPPLIESNISSLQILAQSKDLNLKVFLPDEHVVATLDPDQFIRVLTNLVSNAIKFTDDGGIIVSVEQNGKELVLKVTDTGVGIEKNKCTNIFDPFVRSSEDQGGGNGIGLSIAKSLVEAHNGNISVESVPDSGSTFTARFPQS